ncbi:DUF1906 domain-containing protein [Pseudonocardiaceae bacterium YIM PH 21723]|nr:DUF1906 domain-containing protein [Pseudonocardiaceae bacterium YIM PH 21723]
MRKLSALGAALATVLALPATATAAPAVQDIEYRGYHFSVPATWQIIDLATDPTACVRMDRKALYLGTPAADQNCPAKIIGRTEAIAVQPSDSAERGTVENPVAQEFSAVADRIQVSATYDSDRQLIRDILTKAKLPADAPRNPAPRDNSSARVTAAGNLIDHIGKGFDTCAAPSSSAMQAWKNGSPYGAAGIYIGGSKRGCKQPNLTASWVNEQAAAGWKFMPIYVGPQAADLGSPATQGRDAANDAIAQAQSLGFGAGSLLHYDMEQYTAGYRTNVLAFLSAWTQQLHARGYRSSVYSSASSGMKDLAQQAGTGYTLPDAIFGADWDNSADTDIQNVGPGLWSGHQRIKQYAGEVTENYGGVSLRIDRDYLDIRFGGSTTTSGPAYHATRLSDGNWTDWVPSKGIDGAAEFRGSVTGITALPDNSAQVAGVGADGNVYHNIRFANGTWQGWGALPGYDGGTRFQASSVAIAGLPDKSAQVVAIGNDGNLYDTVRLPDGNWRAWAPLAGYGGAPRFGASAVAVTGLADGTGQLVAVGNDGNVYHAVRRADGTVTGWAPVTGYDGAARFAATAVSISGLPDKSAQLLAIGNDGNVYHNIRFANGTWQGWGPLPGYDGGVKFAASAVAITGVAGGSAQLLAVGNDGRIYHNIRFADGNWQGWGQVRGPGGAAGFAASAVTAAGFADGSVQFMAIGR